MSLGFHKTLHCQCSNTVNEQMKEEAALVSFLCNPRLWHQQTLTLTVHSGYPWDFAPQVAKRQEACSCLEFIFSPSGSASSGKRTRVKSLDAGRREQKISPQKDLQVITSLRRNSAWKLLRKPTAKRVNVKVQEKERCKHRKTRHTSETQRSVGISVRNQGFKSVYEKPHTQCMVLFLDMCMWGAGEGSTRGLYLPNISRIPGFPIPVKSSTPSFSSASPISPFLSVLFPAV